MSRELLQPWEPTAADPFDLRKAGHLLRRAAIGGDLELRQKMVRRGPRWAVDQVTSPGAGEREEASMLEDVVALNDPAKLRAYRVWRALHGRHRLREQMSLFWHGHFATSIDKVQSSRLMARHLALFDDLGLGRFDDLVLEVSRDPAMVRWLDSETSVVGSPNENYARELFELFALGRGNYTERDIQGAARAFTGWHLRGESFRFVPHQHDAGEKEVFGRRGNFGGEDVVAMTVRRAESARFVASRLLAFFVHPEPGEAEIEALATVYLHSDRHVGRTLDILLRSRLFFSPRAYRSRIKSPVDYGVGMVRCCGARVSPVMLAEGIGRLGQVLLAPPSVEGWHGERSWITSATWILRANLASEVFASGKEFRFEPEPGEFFEAAASGRERADLAITLLLDGDVSQTGRDSMRALAASRAGRGPGGNAALLHAVQSLPEAHLS